MIDAGSLQYVVDQLCGRVLRVFGDKPVVEGGPFTLDDTGDDDEGEKAEDDQGELPAIDEGNGGIVSK